MKTIFNFIKRAAKAYFRITAENYSFRCTGDVYIPPTP